MASAIKRQWSESEIVWIVDKRFRGILDCCPLIDQVVERPSKPKSVRDLGQFDVALDMQGLFKSGILVAFANAQRKLGYHWQREGASLFTSRVMPDPTSLHVVDQYVDVARALGADCDRAEFALQPKEKDLETVKERLASKGWHGEPFVLCNAGAGWVTKRWNPQKFAALADRISAEGTPTVFLGAPSDRAAFDEVREQGAGTAIDMVGQTSVSELVALVSLARTHVGGDTGSSHIAAALGVPTVGVYTMTRPERSCPYGQFENCFTGDPDVEAVHQKVVSLGVVENARETF